MTVAIKRGWALLRVSSVNQGKTQHGSLEQQDHRMRRFMLEAKGETGAEYQVTKVIAEKRSGRREKFHLRKGFQETITAIHQHLIDFVVIESVERMGRWAKKNLEVMEAAKDAGVEIWFVDGGKYDYRDKGKRIDFAIKNMLAEEGTHENEERVSKKQREAMLNNGKDTSTSPLLGLDAHPTKVGMYAPNKDELKIGIDIFEKFCDLKSFKFLKSYCADKGYRTKERWTKESTDEFGNRIPPRRIGGEPFDEQRLRILLTSPKLRGHNYFVDEFDQFPKLQGENKLVRWEYAHFREHGHLIPLELTERVDETLKRFERHRPKSSKYGNVYLLSNGVLKDHNGNPFYGSSGKRGQNLYYYNRTTCTEDKKTVKKEEIEAIAINRLKQYFRESGTLEKVVKAALKNRLVGLPLIEEEIPNTQRRVNELERIVSRFSEALQKAALDSDGDLAKVAGTLTAEREKAETELEQCRAQLKALLEKKEQVISKFQNRTVDDYVQRVMEHFDKKDDLQKKAIIQAVIPEIVIHADNSVELRVNPDPSGACTRPPFGCHGGGSGVVLSQSWRIRRRSS